MCRKLGFRKKRKGYASTQIVGNCGNVIVCRTCHYYGLAEVVDSNCLGSGTLERCPLCHSLNFGNIADGQAAPQVVQLAMSL